MSDDSIFCNYHFFYIFNIQIVLLLECLLFFYRLLPILFVSILENINGESLVDLLFFSFKIKTMTQRIRKKRFHLSLVVNQTRKMLLLFLGSIAICLFILQLFLLNNIALRGYVLSKLVKQNAQLLQTNEQLDVQLARLQTQEFITKINTTKQMVEKNVTQQYVFISNKFTASIPSNTQ